VTLCVGLISYKGGAVKEIMAVIDLPFFLCQLLIPPFILTVSSPPPSVPPPGPPLVRFVCLHAGMHLIQEHRQYSFVCLSAFNSLRVPCSLVHSLARFLARFLIHQVILSSFVERLSPKGRRTDVHLNLHDPKCTHTYTHKPLYDWSKRGRHYCRGHKEVVGGQLSILDHLPQLLTC